MAAAASASFLFSLWLFCHRSHGYYSFHGDDEARSLIAYSVYRGGDFPAGSRILTIKPGGFFPHWIWLPFQFWFNAVLLAVVRNPRLVSFISNGAFSTGTAVIMYLLIKLISGNHKVVAGGGMLWYMSIPFFRCLNISGLDLPILHFFILAGVYLWLRAEASSRGVLSLWPAAVCFFLASMVRYEGWFFVAAFEFAVFLRLIVGRSGPDRRWGALVLALPLVFIGIWLVDQRLRYHDLLFLSYYRTEALSGIGQLFGRETWRFKATIYPRLAFQGSPLVMILAPFAFLLWRRTGRLLLRYTGFIVSGLIILSAAAVYGGVPYTPERIAYIILLLLLPLAAAGVWGLAGFMRKNAVPALACGLFLGGISAYNFWETPRSLRNSMTEEIARIGYILEWAVKRGVIAGNEKIVFEERVLGDGNQGRWDSIRLTLFAPDQMICDREDRVVVKGGKEYTDPAILPSSFLRRLSGESLRDYLQDNCIQIAVAWSENVKRKLAAVFLPCFSTPQYSIFFSPAKSWAQEPLRIFLAGRDPYRTP